MKCENERPDLTISLISADNLGLLLPCLRSILERTHRISLEIWVVDNASSDDTAGKVQESFPGVQVIRNSERQGFSTNNDMVLERGQGRYLMLLNDDTLVLDGALDRMVEFMDANPQVGAVGASLLNPDRSCQPSFAYFPNPILEGIWPSFNWSHYLTGNTGNAFEVDVVHGAAMIVRRDVLQHIGMLDRAFDPIYSEEVDWCYRIKQAGRRIYSLPEASIIHYSGSTMNRMMPRKYELLLSHRVLFFRKHGGPISAGLFKLSLFVTTVIKFILWSLSDILRSQREPRMKKGITYWHLLKRIKAF